MEDIINYCEKCGSEKINDQCERCPNLTTKIVNTPTSIKFDDKMEVEFIEQLDTNKNDLIIENNYKDSLESDEIHERITEKKTILRLEEQCLKIILQSNYWKENVVKLTNIISSNIQLLIQLHCISGMDLIEQWTKIRMTIFKEGAVTKKTLFQNTQIANFYWNKKPYEKLKNSRGGTIALISYKEMKIIEKSTKREFLLRKDEEVECEVGGFKTHPWMLMDENNNHLAILNPNSLEISKKILMQSKPWMKISEKIKDKIINDNPHWQKMYTLDWPLNEKHKKRPGIIRKSYKFTMLRAATILLFCTKYFSPFISTNVFNKRVRNKNIIIKISNLNPAIYLPKNTPYTALVKLLISQPPPTISYQARAWHETNLNGHITQHTVWRHTVNLEGLISPHPPILKGMEQVQRFCESTNAIRLLIYQKKVDIDFKRIGEKINSIIKPRILELYNVPHFSGGIVFGNQKVRVLPNYSCNKFLDNCFVRFFCVLSCLWIIYCPIEYCVQKEYKVVGKYKSDLSFSTIYELFEDELVSPNQKEQEFMLEKNKKNKPIKQQRRTTPSDDQVYLLLDDNQNN